MIIACVIMIILSFKQSANIRGLHREITSKQAWINKNSHIENYKFFQDLESRANAELKKQVIQPAFF